jgi:hypothetical protein
MLVFELDFRRICDCMCGGFENGLLKLLVQGLAIRIQNQKKKNSPKTTKRNGRRK